jgi:hypothetical protein
MSETRRVADGIALAPGDVVRTPSGREARVRGFVGDAVACEYLDDREQLTLRPMHLTLVRKGEEP